MEHRRIRQEFIDYFTQHGHTLVPASNIIPANDPTLLFTNAGMNQFKDALLGREKRSYSRCISVQPCIRVGGKHNDLDAVGRDGRHNTWFEMLGNWSFGDYYKEEAICYAWELVTKGFGLDTSRLYASVYKDDDESAALWKKISTLPDSRIVRLGDIEAGDEENFWSMGPVGPCGPCTELYYDQGEALGEDVVGGETDRYLEFWNLVFMEFDRAEDGTLSPLAMKSVDTGLGLERICALLQGKTNVFHTDLFTPILDGIANLTSRDFKGEDETAMCVVADHIRGLTFVLKDGGEFDRVGRGYVLRRILRRAVMHGKQLGMNEPWLYRLVQTTIDAVGHYDVSDAQMKQIQETIQGEEDKFFRTLDRGLVYFNRAVEETRSKGTAAIDGDSAFQLYDTFGFPVDLTRILAEKEQLEVDIDGFEARLAEQRARSKDAQEFYDAGGWQVLNEGEESGFAGYDLSVLPVTVLRYRRTDAGVDVILDRTPFYVEGGGEEADHGHLRATGLEIAVTDVQRTDVGIIHSGTFTHGDLDVLTQSDGRLEAEVDVARRRAKAAHHTATHLVHRALRDVLGPNTRQMGSLVTDDRLRFDFSTGRALTPEEIEQIETQVNGWILEDHPVNKHPDIPYQQALDMGALAFFQDNYGDKVRVLEVPGVSTELCGGNHVNHTAEIGSLFVIGEGSVGSGVRRLEAVTHQAALERFRQYRKVADDLSGLFNVSMDKLPERITKLMEDNKRLAKEAERLAAGALTGAGGASLDSQIETVGGTPMLVKAVPVSDPKSLKQSVDNLRHANENGVFVLIGINAEGRGTVVIGLGAETVKAGVLKAGDLAKEIGTKLGAGGGGRPDFAQTGFKDRTEQEAEAAAREAVLARLGAEIGG